LEISLDKKINLDNTKKERQKERKNERKYKDRKKERKKQTNNAPSRSFILEQPVRSVKERKGFCLSDIRWQGRKKLFFNLSQFCKLPGFNYMRT
jgi:beta-lactamase class A